MGITSALTAEINCENNDFFTYGDLGTIIPKNIPIANRDYKDEVAFQRIKGNILYVLCHVNGDKFKLDGYIRVSVDDYIRIASPNTSYTMRAGKKDVDVNVIPCMDVSNGQYMNLIFNTDMYKAKYGYQFSIDTTPNINITRYDKYMNIIGTDVIHELYDLSFKGQYTNLIHRAYDIFTRYTDIQK